MHSIILKWSVIICFAISSNSVVLSCNSPLYGIQDHSTPHQIIQHHTTSRHAMYTTPYHTPHDAQHTINTTSCTPLDTHHHHIIHSSTCTLYRTHHITYITPYTLHCTALYISIPYRFTPHYIIALLTIAHYNTPYYATRYCATPYHDAPYFLHLTMTHNHCQK